MSKIQSMTGFGRAEFEVNGWNYRCEMKTLNSRFIEVNIRMPRSFASIEADLINLIKSTLVRGKVDVFIEISKNNSTGELASLNEVALEHYVKLYDQVHNAVMRMHPKNFSLDTKHSAQEFMGLPEVLQTTLIQTSNTDLILEQSENIKKSIQTALEEVTTARKTEGLKLKLATEELVSQISQSREIIANSVSDLRAFIHETYMKRLEKVISDMEKNGLNLSVPPQERLTAEISYLVEKADIEEELTRIKSHESEFLKTINDGVDIGRKLDFLCQEFHREVNTISSKIQQTAVAEQTLKMKQSIERIRQQVQNIE